MNVVIGASLVYNFDMGVLVLHNLVFNCAVVSIFAFVFDFSVHVGVLREDLSDKELLGERESLYL